MGSGSPFKYLDSKLGSKNNGELFEPCTQPPKYEFLWHGILIGYKPQRIQPIVMEGTGKTPILIYAC